MGSFALNLLKNLFVVSIYILKKVCIVEKFRWNISSSDLLIDVRNLSLNTTETIIKYIRD